jgi:hypothetical protein
MMWEGIKVEKEKKNNIIQNIKKEEWDCNMIGKHRKWHYPNYKKYIKESPNKPTNNFGPRFS